MQENIFEFTGKAQKSILIAGGIGIVLIILGIITFSPAEAGHGDGHGDGHASVELMDQSAYTVAYQEDHGDDTHQAEGDEDHTSESGNEPHEAETTGHGEEVEHHEEANPDAGHGDDQHGATEGHGGGDGGGHHEEVTWLKKLGIDLWINHIYWFGIAIAGLFFFAIQYAAQAGWSSQIKRVSFALGNWLPVAAILGLVLFFLFGHDIFHWTHKSLYAEGTAGYDSIIDGKAGFFYYPLGKGGMFPAFFLIRYVLFFGSWILIMNKMRKLSMQEDEIGGDDIYWKLRKWSAIFLVIFAVSSSVSAWDWVLSIDTHWFSTMFGWYVFASWFVSALAATTLIVVFLKEAGYLPKVNAEHLHDLGKFMFAFSIFWTYVWFSQFLLIYYANIPEETIYFVERLRSDHYAPFFFINLIMNFFLPFLLLMTRDSKRHVIFLKMVAVLILAGHWIDFFLMMTPGTLGLSGNIGFMEIGTILLMGSAFLLVVLRGLGRLPLVPKNDPMLVESEHHHT